jgi:hypothetical protein
MCAVELEAPWPSGTPTLEYRWPLTTILGSMILGVDCLGVVNPVALEDSLAWGSVELEPPW